MLFGWKSPDHMRRGLGGSYLIEAEQFYVEYLNRLYGSGEDDEEDDNDPPWEAEAITGDMT